MKIENYKIKGSSQDTHKGSIFISEEFSYEVYGPFGQGYNIKVKKRHAKLFGKLFSKATLHYHWRNGPISGTKTPKGEYGIGTSCIMKGRNTILEIDDKGNFFPISDEYAMAVFIVNHHFSRKSGPFK